MVSLSIHLVHSTKTLRDQAANTNLDNDTPAMQHPVHIRLAVRTALALQHLAHIRLTVWACNHIDTLPVNPTHCRKPGHRFTNLNRHQLPTTIVQLYLSMTRPMSPTHIERPAAPILDSTILATNTYHLAEDTTTMNFTYALVNITINCHLCCIISPLFPSLSLTLITRTLNLNYLQSMCLSAPQHIHKIYDL